MTLKRALTLLLIGLIIGLLLGTGAAYWRRAQRQAIGPSVPVPTVDSPLSLRCTGGKTPSIHVTWEPRLTSAVGNLERSSDGVTWTPLFTGDTKPVPSGYDDAAVLPDTQYEYRFRVQADAPYTSAMVTTDKAACQ